jgi:hypothetical protein
MNSTVLLTRWLQAICSHDINRILSQYTSDAVLVGTFAQEIKQGSELEGYFRYFLSRPGLCGVLNSSVTQETIPGGPLVVSGTYTFSWQGVQGWESAKARFTFVFVQTVNGWRILTQHSSGIPG